MTTIIELVPWLLGLVLAIVHYFGEELDDRITDRQHHIASFSAGMTVTYIFLVLFPEINRGTHYFGDFAFIFALTGFTLIQLVEKWIASHEHDVEQLRRDYKEVHSVFLFIYYFAIGMVFHYLTAISVVEGVLFFIPVLLHTAVSSISLQELHEDILDSRLVSLGVSMAVLLGVGSSYLFNPGPEEFHVLLGLVTGTFLYLVIHDGLSDQNSAPVSYTSGIIAYTLLIVLTWSLQGPVIS